jgi:hypothetical protein
MNLLLYSPEGDDNEQKLLALTQKKSIGIEIYRSPEAFEARLREPMQIPKIIVIIADPEALAKFSEWDNLLSDRQLVLILTDDSAETIRLAHKFRPRYVALRGDNLEEVGAILERLILRCEVQGTIPQQVAGYPRPRGTKEASMNLSIKGRS